MVAVLSPASTNTGPDWSCASPASSGCLTFLCPMLAGFFCLAPCLRSLQQCLCPWPTCFGLFLWPCGVIRGDGQRVTEGRWCRFANGSSLSPPSLHLHPSQDPPPRQRKGGGDLGDTLLALCRDWMHHSHVRGLGL